MNFKVARHPLQAICGVLGYHICLAIKKSQTENKKFVAGLLLWGHWQIEDFG